MPMKAGWLVCLLAASLGVLAGCGGSSSASSTGNLYVTTQGNALVSPFKVNLSSGVLATNGSGVATGSVPSAVVLTSSGDALFVANGQSNDISRYTVNADGTLTAVTPNQAACTAPAVCTNPVSLASDPGGKFLFVANQGSSNISVFSVSSGAGLTDNVAGSPFATAANPAALAVAPSGTFLYVANNVSGIVTAYSIDSSGALTQVPGPPFTTGTTPSGLAITPKGQFQFLYAANSGSNNVSAFSINTDGTLTPVTGSPFAAGLGPVALAVDPSGNFLYVANRQSNQVSGYRINPSTGALTPTSPAAFATGANPVSIAIHPGGQFVYTANIGADSISGFHINTTSGVLGPLTPVPSGAQPSAIALK